MKNPMAKIGAIALAALACFGTATALADSINLSEVTANTTVADGTTLTGTLGEYEYVKISIADGATVTLDGVTINGYNNDALNWAGITCAGDATIILAGANTVKGFYESYPGIFVPSGKTLTIKGDGSLVASSNGYGAGIGGGNEDVSCGNIVIEGGTIKATGGDYAAGIGGGSGDSCGDITITGGTIDAKGGECAPGIGGGDGGSCGTITIADTVTKVTATKGKDAPCSIGKGNGGSCGTVTIGGTVYASGIAENPYTYVPPAAIDLSTVTEAYVAQDGTTLTGTLGENVKISIADGATVTLDGVAINGANDEDYSWAGITCEGGATIILEGTNTVKGFYENYPGIYVPEGKTLTIKGDGSLDASSNGYGAGIGGGYDISCGNIAIEGGTIVATGGYLATGIGGGGNGSCGAITIADTVTKVVATKYEQNTPRSIGSGVNGTCGTVTIGGTVYPDGITQSPYIYPAYTATLKDGTEDAANWTITPNEGLLESNTVTVAYAGTNTVKSVKAVKPLTLAAATAADIGKVVCAAGHLHDAKTAVPDGCTAVGIIGKVTETGHGLILALQDATAQNWNTINGWTSETGYAGTTLKVLPDDAARGANLTSYTALGNTAVSDWAVAQKSDYDAIFTNLGSTTGDEDGKVYDANVNDYITGVGGAAISGYYWSATEHGGTAWKMESSYWVDYGNKPTSYSIRPVLGFKSGATEEVGEITVTSVEGKTNEWTFAMPAANVEVEVEYFTQEEVDSIAAAKAAIEEIGEVDGTEESAEKVAAARKAYDALTDDLKEFVENYGLLPFAEAKVDAFGEIDTLAETNTSALATELIAAAREAVAAVEYDEEKTPDENMDALELASNGILEELGAALDSIHTVSFAEGTPDAENWTIAPYADGKFAESNTVTAAYSGTNKVKSVKATMKAAAGVTAYTLAESTVGMIVGTDGNAYAAADKDNLPSGVTAAGMVAYKSGSNGLVIALADEASTMDWSTATGASGAAAHTPTITGQTWKLPSQDEWKQMLRANGGDENSYTGLNSALATAGGDSSKLQTQADYWSSSEHIDVSGSGSVYGRDLHLGSGAYWTNDNKNNGYRVRACLAFSGDATGEVDNTAGEVTEEIEITVTPVEGKTNEWTFQMPDGDVKVEVAYLAVATFEVDGETYAVTTNVVGKAVATPEEDPVKAGHSFAGWFTAATGGTQVTDETLMGIADTTFYAQFRAPILTIENGVLTGIDLNGCTNLALTIPDTVTTIGESAFYQCTGLASVTIPGSVKTISHAAFRDCSGLTSVTIEEGVTTIGERAFARCVNLASITIPGTVTEISEAAFSDCKSLTSLTIPGSVKTIGPQAFQNCTGLESVTLEEGVETIRRVAFDGCENLSSVTIPDSVKEIGDDAFAGCSDALYEEGSENLSGVKLVDGWAVGYDKASISENLDLTGVRGIAGGAFAGCDVITSVIIPDGVATIPEYVFNGCDNLTGVTIPDSVTSIGEGAFGGCDNFASVTIPDSVTSIGKDAFEGCSEELFDTTTIPGVALVDGWAIGYTDALPENLDLTGARGIADSAFRGSKLESVTIPGSVARVPAGAFMSCSSLTSVTLEEGVTAIDDSAFIECSALESVEIPDTVTAIGPQAFVSCAKLASVTVPGSVAEIGSAAFGMCPTLTNVTLEAGVTNIGMMAFAMCSALESLEIPDTVTAIGAQAFMMSMNLASVTIPSSVKEIGQDAFLYTALATVNVDYGDGERVKALLAASGVDVSNLTFVEPYKLTFDPNGGAFAEGVETNRFLYAGEEFGELPEATRTGHTFAGWFTEATEGDQVTATSTMGDADATVYAQWTINQYTITFDSNGGSDVAAITNDYGSAVTAPADPAKTGYTFSGWTPAVPETIPASNTVCTAGWTINQYTISFDANGGEGEFDPATLDYGSEYGELPVPVRTGYTFNGWFTAATDGDQVAATNTMGDADATIYAQWTVNQYTITFDSNGGSDVAAITNDYGTEVTAPADPAKTGYTFTGWTPAVPETIPASNTVCTAGWTINQYTISFDANGGEGEFDPATLDYGLEYGELPVPVRTGYTFKGWFTAATGGDQVAATNTMGEADATIYAQWTINQYTITFDSNGGSDVATITNDYGTEVTAPEGPAKTGYTFSGWTPAVPETIPASNTVCTAGWTINQYTISFDVNGGEGEFDPATLDYSSEYGELPVPVRTGYTFKGWTDGDGNAVTAETVLGAADVTLKAQWEINQYTITFVVEGETYAAITNDYGTEVTAPEAPTKTGYTFAGWTPAVPETIPASNTVCTAGWTINQYTISFDANGGEGEFDPATLDYGSEYGELPVPVRTGYTFKDWTDGDGNAVTAETVLGAADVELKAQWEINQYTITFVVEGETYAAITNDYGAAVTAPADPDRGPSYKFLGWDVEVPATVPAEDVTLTALWKLMQIDVPEIVGGDTNTTVNVTVGEVYTDAVIEQITEAAQSTATRHGQVVAGWVNYDGSEVTGSTIVSTNDVLTAVWTTVNPLVPETKGEGAVDTSKAQKYEAYILDGEGGTVGTVVVSVGKANKKSGLSSVKAQVKLVGETKTYTFKATEAKGGKAALPTDVATEGVELYNKNLGTMTLDIGAEGVSGVLGEYEIDGSRNVYKTDKAAYAAWKGTWTAAIADADGAYSTFSVKVKKNGSVSVKGVASNGAKFSATTRLMVADDGGEACVAVKGNKKVPVGFTLWLGLDADGAACAEGVESASGDAVAGEGAVVGKAAVADAETWTLSAGGEQVASLGWNGSRFSGDKAVSAKVSYVKSTGVFSGSYKVATTSANGKAKKTTVKFSGVFVDGVGYGATKGAAVPVVLAPVPAE